MADSTEKLGLKAVIAYEAKQQPNRIAKRVHGCGYDLLSTGGSEERHIEVKATLEGYFTSRWLEQREYDQLQNDKLFFLYLVTDAHTNPRIFVYDRKTLIPLFTTKSCKYYYKFPKIDFAK